jgi:hypothetical protein
MFHELAFRINKIPEDMKARLFLLIAGVQLACLGTLFGQSEIKLKAPMTGAVDSDIPQSDIDSIIKFTEETLNKYVRVAKFKLDETIRSEEEMIEEFKSVFNTNTAVVMRDFEMYPGPDLIPLDEYIRKVTYYFPGGFNFAVGEPSNFQIRNDGEDWYLISLKIPKNMFSVVKDQQPTQKPDGRLIEQNIYFQVNKNRMNKAEITKITNASTKGPAEDYTDIISLFGSVGTSSPSISESEYWNSNHSSSTLSVTGGLNFSFGAEFVTNRILNSKGSSEKKLALSAGVMFSSFAINTELGSYNSSYDERASNETGSQLYLRLVDLPTVNEDIRMNTVQIPLGIGYRIMDNRDFFIQAFVKAIPGFIIGGSGNVSGNSVYDGIFYLPDETTLSDFRILDEMATNQATQTNPNNFGPYNVGEQNIDLESEPDLASTFLTLQFSPTAHFKFDNRSSVWGLSVGVDVGYQFSSLFEHNPITTSAESPLGTRDDFDGSLLNYFSSDSNSLVFGLRVGLSHFNMTSPR